MNLIKKTIIIVFAFILLFLNMLNINIEVNANELFTETVDIIEEEIYKLFGNKQITSIEYLYNLDESPDYIYVKFEYDGFVIFTNYTLDVIEYSEKGNLPYESNEKKYYAGPGKYISKIDNEFINIYTNKVIVDDDAGYLLENTKTILDKITKENNIVLDLNSNITNKNLSINSEFTTQTNEEITNTNETSNSEPVYIDNYEYFMVGPYHGANTSGTCSAIAAQILLGFHNYYNDRRLIDNKYLFNGEDNPNTCTNPYTFNSNIIGTRGRSDNGEIIKEDTDIGTNQENSYLLKVVNAIPPGSNYESKVNGINQLLEERRIENGLSESLATVSYSFNISDIKNEINAGRPVILNTDDDNQSPGHTVVGYGYQTIGESDSDEGQLGFIVHEGWAGPSNWSHTANVWYSAEWCHAFVKMEVHHEHSYGEPEGIYYIRECEDCKHRISDLAFETEVINNEVFITGLNFMPPSNMIIPSKIDGLPVKSIASNAFLNLTNLQSIVIPDTVEIIENGAFSGCSSLETIILPFTGNSRAASIGCSSFGYIFGNVSYNGSYSVLQNGVTYYIPVNLENVTITDSNNIQDYAFQNCNNLKKIQLSSKVRHIGNSSFYECDNLETIELANSLSSIGNYAFYGCNVLESFDDEIDNLVSIGDKAFYNCVNLDGFTFPSTLESIGNNCFENCEELNTVTFRKETNPITYISKDVFKNCSKLSGICVPDNKLFMYKNQENLQNYKDDIFSEETISNFSINPNELYQEEISISRGINYLREINVETEGIYIFNIESDNEIDIKIYNESYELYESITQDNNEYIKYVCFEEGIYYIDIYCLDYTKYENINLSIEFTEEYDLYFNTEYSISNHLIEYGTEYISFLKYNHLEKNGLYKISINNISNSDLEEGTITIYTNRERTSILESYNITDFVNEAITKTGDNSLYVYLHKNTTYYINIKLNDNFQDVTIKIENLLDTELSIFNQSNIMSAEFINVLSLNDNIDNTSHFKKLIIKEKGIFTTVVNYEGMQSSDIKVIFFGINSDGEYTNLNTLTLNSTKKSITISYRELDAGAYCIGYYNLDKSICTSIDISFSRFIDNGSDSVYNGLMVDPNAPGMYGTQIRIVEKNATNKSYGDTYITKGFTRLLFIDSSYDYPTSRTQYEWYSSDENVLSVTSYGTVLGKSEGTAKVIGVNKDNPSIIFVKEFTIIDNIDEEIHIIEINQTYSLSSNNELILNLNSSNCPYPYIQYYEFEIIECAGDTYLNAFGRIIANTPGEIVVEGVYCLNSNYIVKVTIDVTT